ncbi:MAG: extracellular solute-binding protein [Loktanella sp.]|nr:extracellular solute-binding protein [Loktanella sp.]
MTKMLLSTAATAALIGLGSTASADCAIEGEGSVRILANDFQALNAVVSRAAECASDTVEVTTNETEEHKDIQVAALSTDPAAYTVALVANGSLVPLLNEGLTRPLDDLVAEYGEGLMDSQLVRVNGEIVAIAFMANSQMLHYRADLLEENGIAVPETYEDMIAASQSLADAGVMADQMSSDFLTYDSNEALPYWEAEEVALKTGWGSRTAAFIDENGAAPEIAAQTKVAAMPSWGDNDIPATTLWWDGFTMAKNISDEDAAATFQAMMYALSPELVADPETAALAAWLVDGYTPTPASEGVFANVEAGARPYPMTPYMGMLHTALGNNLAEFLQGQESAEKALEDAVADYTTAATEAGFLQ